MSGTNTASTITNVAGVGTAAGTHYAWRITTYIIQNKMIDEVSELNENNYVIFAIKYYENPHAVTKEDFEEDLKRFKWIKDF